MARQRPVAIHLSPYKSSLFGPWQHLKRLVLFIAACAKSQSTVPFWMYLIVSHISTLDVHQEVVVKADSLKFAK